MWARSDAAPTPLRLPEAIAPPGCPGGEFVVDDPATGVNQPPVRGIFSI
jgi:hypothetical protein